MRHVRESVDRLPAKMRELGRDIRAMTTSLSDTRLQQLLNRLVQFTDLLDGLVQKGPDASAQAGVAAHDTYKVLHTQALQILRLSGVKELTPKRGAAFDASHQRATARVATRSAKRDKTICEVQRTGFESGGEILRYPEVTVYMLEPAAETAGKNGEEHEQPPS